MRGRRRRRRAHVLALFVAAASLVAGAGCAPVTPAAPPAVLPASGTVDYQLGSPSTPPPGASVVVRDASAPRPDVAFAVCYVNGFQTQPGEADAWLAQQPGSVLRDAAGAPVVDPAWPDELVLDTRTATARAGIVAMLRPVIEACAASGYDAVELDNLDTFERFDALRADDAIALAAALGDLARGHGMHVAQKNALSLGARGRDEGGFAFAITEECLAWGECAEAAAVYGGDVIDVEYDDQLTRDGFLAGCGELPRLSVWRDRLLAPEGDPARSYAVCPQG